MDLYGIRSCDTCRKAVRALEAAGHAVRFHDVRAEPLARGVLAEFHAAFGAELVNRRSTTWRGLPEAARTADPLTLLGAHPAVMKRPAIRAGGRALYLGWSKSVQAALI